MTKLTDPQRRALELLEQAGDRVSAAQFGQLMWPDSPGHTKRSHRHATPAGGAIGAGIAMTAGRFLWRLVGLHLVNAGTAGYFSRQSLFTITERGRKALKTGEYE